MKLSELIKNYREENDLSQREFARRCGLSNSLISILEMGVNPQTGKPTEPDARTWRRLSDGMGISPSDLMKMLKMDSIEYSLIDEGDQNILEALHQKPSLGLLFDRSIKMSDADIDFMIQMADRILKERDD